MSYNLREQLEADLGSAEEAEQLLPILEKLKAWSPLPTDEVAFNHLRASLLSEMPKQRWWHQFDNWLLWLIVRAQLRVVQVEIWLASAATLLLGTLVTILRHDPTVADGSVLMILLAPLVAAGSVTFIYGQTTDPPFEILLATPVSSRLVMLARLMLVFGFDLAISLLCSVLLVAMGASHLSLWTLILAWLAPMTFLSALAFCLGVVSREPLLGGLTSWVLWFVQFIDLEFIQFPDLMNPQAQPILMLFAMFLGMVSLWLVGVEEHWIRAE